MAITLSTGFATGMTPHTARKHGYNSFYRICHRNDSTQLGSMAIILSTGFATGTTAHSKEAWL